MERAHPRRKRRIAWSAAGLVWLALWVLTFDLVRSARTARRGVVEPI